MPIKVYIETADPHFGEAIKAYLHSCDFDIVQDIDVANIVIYSTDLNEPSAYGLCQDLRRVNKDIPIIILSNEITLGEDVKAQYAGATEVFAIPFEPKVLSNFIRQGKQHGEY